ncbi:hypothetical protein CORC01_12559 [Colletotrichum orchidophilum]|uniref:Uncharacterized protein n=1 Tax=Colletotrichum orchidophilum TaxID=1209926 RepID=A0A1G4ASR9_9PEZI|nr:uncharacterized protein CORC01_12559 [Colletotrichum orchidophilum]OHE92156.1 hypothetical protein CORC01_12559 [Colletotrichum orchidophilum]
MTKRRNRMKKHFKKQIEEDRHDFDVGGSQESQESEGSAGSANEISSVTGPREMVWPNAHVVFEDWADRQIDGGVSVRKECRWKCCKCGWYNAMPRSRYRLMHCRNPDGCVVDLGTRQVHAGPGFCCAIVGPEGAWDPRVVRDLRRQ